MFPPGDFAFVAASSFTHSQPEWVIHYVEWTQWLSFIVVAGQVLVMRKKRDLLWWDVIRGESWFKRSQGEDCFHSGMFAGRTLFFVGHKKVASNTTSHLFESSVTFDGAVIEPAWIRRGWCMHLMPLYVHAVSGSTAVLVVGGKKWNTDFRVLAAAADHTVSSPWAKAHIQPQQKAYRLSSKTSPISSSWWPLVKCDRFFASSWKSPLSNSSYCIDLQ